MVNALVLRLYPHQPTCHLSSRQTNPNVRIAVACISFPLSPYSYCRRTTGPAKAYMRFTQQRSAYTIFFRQSLASNLPVSHIGRSHLTFWKDWTKSQSARMKGMPGRRVYPRIKVSEIPRYVIGYMRQAWTALLHQITLPGNICYVESSERGFVRELGSEVRLSFMLANLRGASDLVK